MPPLQLITCLVIKLASPDASKGDGRSLLFGQSSPFRACCHDAFDEFIMIDEKEFGEVSVGMKPGRSLLVL